MHHGRCRFAQPRMAMCKPVHHGGALPCLRQVLVRPAMEGQKANQCTMDMEGCRFAQPRTADAQTSAPWKLAALPLAGAGLRSSVSIFGYQKVALLYTHNTAKGPKGPFFAEIDDLGVPPRCVVGLPLLSLTRVTRGANASSGYCTRLRCQSSKPKAGEYAANG